MSQLRILHVEDDPDDALFFFRAIKKAKPNCEFHRETNGEAAVNYLRAALANGLEASVPNLMILDLKLPGMSGFEVLAWTRAQAALKALPIFVLSGSSLAQDRRKATELGATEFLVKHSHYDQLIEEMIALISPSVSAAPAGPLDIRSK